MEMLSRSVDMPAAQAHCGKHALPDPSARRYEDIVLLASIICETPIAFIILFDSDRIWIKEKIGLDISVIPEEGEFRWRIGEPDNVLVVPDMLADQRFARSAWIRSEAALRFYAGVSLADDSGKIIGALCVMDRRMRILPETKKQALCALARQATFFLENDCRMAALQENELRFKTFMDNSPALAWLKDEDSRYLYVNKPFLKRCGLLPSAILGKTDAEIWPQNTAQQIRRNEVENMVETKAVSELEIYVLPDGQSSYWQVSRFLIDGPRRLEGCIGLEVTESKRYEEQLMQYQQELKSTLQRLEVLSVTDGLTELYNRRAFDDRLMEEFERARRYRLPLSLLLIDVDNFKQFNDAMGHTEGDELLRSIAAMLKENARANDVTARYGGDEFVVILPNTNSKVAYNLGERLRSSARKLSMVPFQITLSIGVAALLPDMQRGRELIVAADRALYAAKRGGRNQVSASA